MSETGKPLTRHFERLGFTVRATPHDYHVDFNVYAVTGSVEGAKRGVFDVPIYASERRDGDVESLDEAAVYLHGFVKWDGCSNWHFDEQERVMLHGCTRADLTNIGEVMAACWDWTAELCPNWQAME